MRFVSGKSKMTPIEHVVHWKMLNVNVYTVLKKYYAHLNKFV